MIRSDPTVQMVSVFLLNFKHWTWFCFVNDLSLPEALRTHCPDPDHRFSDRVATTIA
jgi:hypothetical protein